jgi:hypothetical protein
VESKLNKELPYASSVFMREIHFSHFKKLGNPSNIKVNEEILLTVYIISVCGDEKSRKR